MNESTNLSIHFFIFLNFLFLYFESESKKSSLRFKQKIMKMEKIIKVILIFFIRFFFISFPVFSPFFQFFFNFFQFFPIFSKFLSNFYPIFFHFFSIFFPSFHFFFLFSSQFFQIFFKFFQFFFIFFSNFFQIFYFCIFIFKSNKSVRRLKQKIGIFITEDLSSSDSDTAYVERTVERLKAANAANQKSIVIDLPNTTNDSHGGKMESFQSVHQSLPKPIGGSVEDWMEDDFFGGILPSSSAASSSQQEDITEFRESIAPRRPAETVRQEKISKISPLATVLSRKIFELARSGIFESFLGIPFSAVNTGEMK